MKLIIIIVLVVVCDAFERLQKCKSTCGSSPTCCERSRYRSYDGSCNNLENPRWGSANSAYARMIPNSYSDGIHAFPTSCKNQPLMNPRDISLKVFPDVIVTDPKWNVITLQWGQVVAHDMSLTKNVAQANDCCKNGKPILPESQINNRCANIPIPCNDPYNAPEGITCMNFVRTSTNRDANCLVPGRTIEPLSEVTAFHDLSVVYGNSKSNAQQHRAYQKGKLLTVVRKGQQWPPQVSNATSTCNVVNNREACYLTGDIRVNQNPQLALVQILLMRDHNLIAEALCGIINPHWDDERCYQEARRILIAKAQHITYYEFLQIFLGVKNVIEYGLAYPNEKKHVNDYDPKVNPATLNEHATAAFRNYHTEVVGQLKMYSESRNVTGQIRLSDWFLRPSVLEDDDNFSKLTRGLCTQPQNNVDKYFDAEITQYLFRGTYAKLGDDLRAIDIQRSRDHGLGTYVDARKACCLSVPTCFDDFKKYMPQKYVELLRHVYNSYTEVELIVAGALETLVPGTLAGPTFLCIMTKQFYRTRVGDRFFFENGNSDGAFTARQLNSIRNGASMSRLLCDTVKQVRMIQPNAFLRISNTNSLVPCATLPKVDLNLWREIPK